MNPLQPIETQLAALIANLYPATQKQMALSIARKLCTSQQRNLKSQKAPDSTPFKPLKAQLLRGPKRPDQTEIFTKLRTAKYIKSKDTGDGATVEFTGRVQPMAACIILA